MKQLLYGSWPEKRKLLRKYLWCLSIVSSIVGIILFGYIIFYTREILFIIAPLVLLPYGFFMLNYASTRELQICHDWIIVPTKFGKQKVAYSKVSEIKLNTQQEIFVPEIEIILKDGCTLKYPKTQIHDWKEFYRVMLEELKGKVKVVE